MCLVAKWKNPRVLKRDKIVWKALYSNYRSVVRLYKYTLDKVESTEMDKRGDLAVNEGFHSCLTKKDAETWIYPSSVRTNKEIIVRFKIPAGSKYYKGIRKDEIVSNQIVMIGG